MTGRLVNPLRHIKALWSCVDLCTHFDSRPDNWVSDRQYCVEALGDIQVIRYSLIFKDYLL